MTEWELRAPIEAVWNVIKNTAEWPTWWRGVQSVTEVTKGNSDGLGSISEITWRSHLPYRLRFHVEVTRITYLKSLEGHATGELEGTGQWFFKHQNGLTSVLYVWKVRTNKLWMRQLDFLLRPAFRWNHDKVMQWGYEGLAHKLS